MYIHFSRVFQTAKGKGSPVVQELIKNTCDQTCFLVTKKRFILTELYRKNEVTFILHFGGIHVFLLVVILKAFRCKIKLVYHGTDLHAWSNGSLKSRFKVILNRWASLLSMLLVENIYVVSPSLLKHIPISQIFKAMPLQLGIDVPGKLVDDKAENMTLSAAFVDNNLSPVKNRDLAERYADSLSFALKCFQGLSHAEFLGKLSNMDALIITSFAEGSPNVVREALALKVPLYCVNVGDCWEWIERFGGFKIDYSLKKPRKVERNINFGPEYLSWSSSKLLLL